MNHEPAQTGDEAVIASDVHAISVFLASLATLNTDIARYVLQECDTFAEPTPLVDELALAERLATAAAALCEQIKRREQYQPEGR